MMVRSMFTVVSFAWALVAGSLLLLVEAVGLAGLASPASAGGALLLGALAGLLTTFAGCASVPTVARFAEARGRIETARERYGKEKVSIQLKLNEIERLAGEIEAEADKMLGVLRTDRAKIAALAREIEERREEVASEATGQAQTVDVMVETAQEMIAQAEEVRARAEALLRQSNVELPGSGDRPRYVLGWSEYLGEATAVLERARARLELKQQQREQLRQHAEVAMVALASLGELAEELAREPVSRRRGELCALARALYEQARMLVADHVDLLHLGFGNGWQEVLAVAEFFTANKSPTVVMGAPAGAGRTVRLVARIRLDEPTVGPFTTGDVLVLSLPEGFTLGASVGVEASPGLELTVCGNEPGSRAVTVEIGADAGTGQKAVTIDVDQELTIDGASPLGWAWAWSLARNTGATLPVAVLPC